MGRQLLLGWLFEICGRFLLDYDFSETTEDSAFPEGNGRKVQSNDGMSNCTFKQMLKIKVT